MIPPTARFNEVLQATAPGPVVVRIRPNPPELVKFRGKNGQISNDSTAGGVEP
jgi:hypothetical protein